VAESAFSVALALELVAGSLSLRSGKSMIGAGTGSAVLPVASDCVINEQVWV
jgi:hypothetical protein